MQDSSDQQQQLDVCRDCGRGSDPDGDHSCLGATTDGAIRFAAANLRLWLDGGSDALVEEAHIRLCEAADG